MSSPKNGPAKIFAIVVLVLLILIVGWTWRTSTPPEPPVPPVDASVPGTSSTAGVPRPVPAAATATTAANTPVSDLPDALVRTVAENALPGRILFLDFVLDRGGVRLVSAQGAAGRAKPGATRAGFGFIHYEVFDAADRLTLSGSVEDPTRRRIEHPAASNDGRIASTVQLSEEGSLSLRLPGESAPARIVLFRDTNPAVPTPSTREILGNLTLRSGTRTELR